LWLIAGIIILAGILIYFIFFNNPAAKENIEQTYNVDGTEIEGTPYYYDDLSNVDLNDLDALVDYLFVSYEEPVCMAEANIDGQGIVDIGDLTALIDFLFLTHTDPAPCPGTDGSAGLKPPKYTNADYERAMDMINEAANGKTRQAKDVVKDETIKLTVIDNQIKPLEITNTTKKQIMVVKKNLPNKQTTGRSIVIGPLRAL
ncbi:MAG: hypothetical protein KKC05_00900, partial [Nanoarchaeota archaeon]|nr:hypothetical protein [Nanoarchaeota archaeon]